MKQFPKDWYLPITKDNIEICDKWRKENAKSFLDLKLDESYYLLSSHRYDGSYIIIKSALKLVHKDYQQITTEEFINHYYPELNKKWSEDDWINGLVALEWEDRYGYDINRWIKSIYPSDTSYYNGGKYYVANSILKRALETNATTLPTVKFKDFMKEALPNSATEPKHISEFKYPDVIHIETKEQWEQVYSLNNSINRLYKEDWKYYIFGGGGGFLREQFKANDYNRNEENYVIYEFNQIIFDKEYTIQELNTNKDLVVYIDNEDEYNKLKKLGALLCKFYGNYCYCFAKENYDGGSSKTNANSYRGVTIVYPNQIKEFKQQTNMKKIIGYKLVKPEYEQVACKIADVNNLKHYPQGYCFEFNTKCKNLLEKAGVLDLWFEPIYESEEKVFNVGDFKLIVKDDKVFHKTEDITNYVKSVGEWYNNIPTKFGNYVFRVTTNIELSHTGCEGQSLLSEWMDVYNEIK